MTTHRYTDQPDLQQVRESSAGFRAILTQYRLRNIRNAVGGGYEVESESGNTYRVERRSWIDRASGSLGFSWRCNCAARKRCRHIDAVERVDYAEALADAQGGDSSGIDIVERTD